MKMLFSSKGNALWELQSASGEELSALMLSVLDRAFKESCKERPTPHLLANA